MLRKALLLALLSTSTLSATAAIDYQESIFGDIDAPEIQTFFLEVGDNHFSGTISDSNGVIDFDSFEFVIADQHTAQIEFSYTFTADVSSHLSLDFISTTLVLSREFISYPTDCTSYCLGTYEKEMLGAQGMGNNDPAPDIFSLDEFINDATVIDFNNLATLESGTYQMDNVSYASSGGVNSTFNYAFNITVQEVPVPAAIWMFGSALVGLAGIKRYK